MNAVAIVAHPDDEIIWCGGLLLQRSQWDWTVLNECREDLDTTRRELREAIAESGRPR